MTGKYPFWLFASHSLFYISDKGFDEAVNNMVKQKDENSSSIAVSAGGSGVMIRSFGEKISLQIKGFIK